MIISHARRFIFIKTLKTGGTSLEMALSKYCAPGDVLTPLVPTEEKQRRAIAGIGAQNYHVPLSEYRLKKRVKMRLLRKREHKYGEHTPGWLVRRRVGEDIWNSYFKFTIVRDPFDRCVSRYFYTKKYFEETGADEIWDRRSFDQFLRYHPEQINENWPMYTEKDQVILDQVARYENLEEDLGEVSRTIGLPQNLYEDMRRISAKSGYRPKGVQPRDLIDGVQRRLIAMLCREEIRTFGYGDMVASGSTSGAGAPRPQPAE
jgi:hypothetical protein